MSKNEVFFDIFWQLVDRIDLTGGICRFLSRFSTYPEDVSIQSTHPE